MRKTLAAAALVLCIQAASAAPKEARKQDGPTFVTVVSNPVTTVKNQFRSGTCWAFSTISFLESEAIRINGISNPEEYPDFSEFFVVSNSYYERGVKYVRLDGNLRFAAGSCCGDVLEVVRDHGIVPQSEMSGMNYGTELPVQAELDAVLKAFVDVIVSKPNKTLSTAWKRAYGAIIDEYLGRKPQTFSVDGREYTPASYRDRMGINPDDYVNFTSFVHHPFYTGFAVEVEDNWRQDESWNLPLEEMMQVIDNALNNGYTVAWGADVSHKGFSRKDGTALLLAGEKDDESGSRAELVPTQESRQTEYDNKTLTDDHGMHIYGIARDRDGKKFYVVKNSWGETGPYKGIWYVSEAYMAGQTLNILVHKDAVPASIREKLGI